MRSIAVASLALAAMLGLATAEPAAAWDDGRNYHGTGLYVHHHTYAPPRIRNVYAVHSPGPYHVHVVQFGGYPYVLVRFPRRLTSPPAGLLAVAGRLPALVMPRS